ncbi:hypothetical protein E3N88_32644 [Mikania micrantha]|uniref:Reverse transcriptase Ty1/copia-type domain-containing protein n=1 Tax=Mikania micrantha TaxID=192012 RepID=A0A5N6M923_9ASTR|nr:hypothetical protein E3N88_32644 [Mikania micrantha]
MEVASIVEDGKARSDVLLFNRWTYDDVQVSDLSVEDYITATASKHPIYMPHTAGRYQAKRFRKAQCPIVERLTNSLMMHGRNNGKKLMAVRIVKHAMEIIHLLTDANPIQIIVDAVINSGPREDATRIGSAGVVRRQAVDISPLRRVNQAIYLLTTGARESAFTNVKTIAECLADELINAAKGSSNRYRQLCLYRHVAKLAAMQLRRKMRLRESLRPIVEDFLRVVPIDGLGQHMSALAYWAILKYRLMIPLFPADEPCPVCHKVCLDSFAFLSQIEPSKYQEALKDNNWVEAMQDELLQFKRQNVWTLCPLPDGKYPIGTRWVFRNKTDDRGIIIKNKARLVVQGYCQEEGIDYDETFAPVARLEAIRLFLAFAISHNIKVYQMDIKSAFLYGTIKEEVYVCQPPGFDDVHHPDWVYKLDKALYGLKQAPRAWYDTLSQFLLSNNFSRGTIDKTLFIKRVDKELLLVQIYVDDIIFGSTKQSMCEQFSKLMSSKFEMSALSELKTFLGLQVKQTPHGTFIHQSKYVKDLLNKFDMNDCKIISTPMATSPGICSDDNGEPVDQTLYRCMIGSLMYLTASRPDIMYATCVCARYQSAPKQSHLSFVKRILRYLKGTPVLGIWYPANQICKLVGFTDSDYAGCSLTRKSTSGGCQFFAGCLVSWQSKKQTSVSNSTAEAEYIAAAHCTAQILWLQYQLLDFGITELKTPLLIDSEAAKNIIKNHVYHSKTKHIEIRHHFIRDCFEKGLIVPEHVSTSMSSGTKHLCLPCRKLHAYDNGVTASDQASFLTKLRLYFSDVHEHVFLTKCEDEIPEHDCVPTEHMDTSVSSSQIYQASLPILLLIHPLHRMMLYS